MGRLRLANPPCVVIGASAGGLHAFNRLLPRLDPALRASVIIVSHSGSDDMAGFCELLGQACRLPVQEAKERNLPEPGTVHVAPSGYHLLLEPDGRFALSVDPKVGFSRPSIDVLFESAAEALGSALIGVILSGANSDGAQGLRCIRGRGGVAIVQDPAEAEVDSMPRAALETSGADYCLRLDEIAEMLNRLCAGTGDETKDPFRR